MGISFGEDAEIVYSSVSPLVKRFYKWTVLYSHEDVLDKKSRPTSLPFSSSSIVGRRPWNNKEDAIAYRRLAKAEWLKANWRITELFSEQELLDKFVKSFRLYLEWLPDTPPIAGAMIMGPETYPIPPALRGHS
jgi:hypothetical protein